MYKHSIAANITSKICNIELRRVCYEGWMSLRMFRDVPMLCSINNVRISIYLV